VDRRDAEDGADWMQRVTALEEEGRRAFIARDFERLSAQHDDFGATLHYTTSVGP
jgi:hypothetical protein